MSTELIDLRSDTVTKPTPEMRAVMAAAEVGDDVIGNDPSVNQLEERTAEILDKEAAIFMPSGTMTNQTAVRLHCGPGDEFLCESQCHIYNYEQGGYAQLTGAAVRPVQGDFGILQEKQLKDLIRPDDDHCVRTRLLCLEITHNRGGGRVPPFENIVGVCGWAHENGLRTHLDGARLFNAVAATGVPAEDWAMLFDTVSVCFSKGLGAPVGSALAGPEDLIREARRIRKLLGGGMRQAGVIAAGALHALEHHRERMVEDHSHAQILAAAIESSPCLKLAPPQVDTNIVIFHVDPQWGTAKQFVSALRNRDVTAIAFSKTQIRLVTHLDISKEQAQRAAGILIDLASQGFN